MRTPKILTIGAVVVTLTTTGVAVLPATASAAPAAVTAMSCFYGDRCFAGLSDGAIFSYTAGHWSRQANVGDGAVTALSCRSTVSGTRCGAAVESADGRSYRALYFDGTHWYQRPSHPGTVTGLDCPSGYCVLVTADGKYSERSRSTHFVWSAPAATGSPSFTALGCLTSPRVCRAGSDAGYVSRWVDRTWQPRHRVDTAGIDAPSCNQFTCQGTDVLGRWLRFDGSTWSAPQALPGDPGEAAHAVDCTSNAFCLLVDSNGYRANWAGGAWHAGGYQGGIGFSALGCDNHTFCMAGVPDGQTYVRFDSHWRFAGRI